MTDLSAAPLPAVFEQLRASPEGLSGEEARRRLAEVGPNEPVGRRRGAALVEVLALLANPLVVVLLIASLVSAALGDAVGSPLRSRPSIALATTTILVVLVGIALPFTPLARPLGFVPPPPSYFGFLALATGTYLVFVELVKRRLMDRLIG
jgi:drug/metabolite transporter (DMT)-like permease